MTITERIAMLDLNEEEKKEEIISKFRHILRFMSDETFTNIVDFLRKNGIKIAKASQFKVLMLPKKEIEDRIDVLKSVNAEDIYAKDAGRLCLDANEIRVRIEYCRAKGVDIKDPDGNYKDVIFNESSFKEALQVDGKNKVVETLPPSEQKVDEIVLHKPEEFKPINASEFENSDIVRFDEVVKASGELAEGLSELGRVKASLQEQLDELNFVDIPTDEPEAGRGM